MLLILTNHKQIRLLLECNCTPYENYLELLDQVDAVSVVVPTSLHHEIALRCFDKNIDVLLEKPMTVTLEEADQLISIAAQKSLVFQVGHLERFNPAVVAMKPFLTTPVFIESNRISTFQTQGG